MKLLVYSDGSSAKELVYPAAYKAKMEEIKSMIEGGKNAEAVAEVFSVVDMLGEDHAVAMLSLIGMDM